MAASVIAIRRSLLIYIFFQRYFVAGVAAAGSRDDAAAAHCAVAELGESRRWRRDFYEQSWRLVLAQLRALGRACSSSLVRRARDAPPALVLLVVAGPLAAALMHCAVTSRRPRSSRSPTRSTALRLHWRRGLVLGAVAARGRGSSACSRSRFYAGLGALAGRSRRSRSTSWRSSRLPARPLAARGAERDRPLRDVARDAASRSLRRPRRDARRSALALSLVNVAGLARGVLPFLTLTVAYTFLAAAHFVLPRPRSRRR